MVPVVHLFDNTITKLKAWGASNMCMNSFYLTLNVWVSGCILYLVPGHQVVIFYNFNHIFHSLLCLTLSCGVKNTFLKIEILQK